MAKTVPSVVILGAGFGGLFAAKGLAVLRGEAKVTVIDRARYHLFTPLLYEVATGFIEHENVGSAKLLDSGVTVENAVLLARWGADFVEGEIAGIDWEGRRVLVAGQDPVAFDHLVIALGAETNFYGIPGLREYGCVLKSIRDADRLRQRVHDALHRLEANKDPDNVLNVVVGGAGATGVEFAAELTMFLRRHLMKGHLGPEQFQISLVEAQSRILGALPKPLAEFSADRLRSLGVKVFLDTAIKDASLGHVTLAPRACRPGETVDQLLCDFKKEGSKSIDADILVWTGGIRGGSTLETLGVPLDPRGKRIEVGPTLEVPGRPGVFAVGDAALLMDPRTKRPVPWLAQAAMVMGSCAAASIARRVRGEAGAAAAYPFKAYPVIVPLGGKFGVAKVGNVTLRGFWGWLLKEGANLRYFVSILPFWAAVRLWWKGALMYSKND